MEKWFKLNDSHSLAHHHLRHFQTTVGLFGYVEYFIPEISNISTGSFQLYTNTLY